MEYLAKGLCERNLLSVYVRPYINKGRTWEKILETTPLLGKLYDNTFALRKIPDGLLSSKVHEMSIGFDITFAMLRRFGNKMGYPGLSSQWSEISCWYQNKIGVKSKKHIAKSSNVVASYGVAYSIFNSFDEKKVLNYPITHWDHTVRVLSHEAEKDKEFSGISTLPIYKKVTDKFLRNHYEEMHLADQIWVGSTYAKNSFLEMSIPESKIKVIPYGVDTNYFTPGAVVDLDKTDKLKVLYVGTIEQRKGVGYLLRAFKKLPKNKYDLTLIGNIKGKSKSLSPYSDLFTHIPHISKDLLIEQYRLADVLVFPSLLEGLGLVVLEAMSCGLPVIVTDRGPNEVVRDGVDGFVVSACDENSLIDRLEQLFNKPDLRIKMSQNARQQAESYSWDQYVNKAVEALYESK